MTDGDIELEAEKYSDKRVPEPNCDWDWGFVQGCEEGFYAGYHKAIEWHDLRKNPNDLPTENMKQVIIKTSDGDYFMGWYCIHQGKWWYDECPDADDEITDVIKWKEIVDD